jgi:hypothetical protein
MEVGRPGGVADHGKKERSVSSGAISCRTCRERVAVIRGCCRRCYHGHWEAVVAGRTTWAELEQQGRLAPARPVRQAWRSGYKAR